MGHIFISYSQQHNKLIGLSLKEKLEKSSKDVWIDLNNLHASSNWWGEIERAIAEADVFVYLLSSESIASEYCQKEFEKARSFNKKIFPILLPGISEKDLPKDIFNIQFLRWNYIETEEGLQKLIYDIDTDHELIRYHTDLLTKAYVWNEANKDTSHLLRGRVLKEAEKRFETPQKNKPELVDLQKDFLLESRIFETQLEKRSIKTRNGLVLLAVAAVLSVVVAIGFGSRFDDLSSSQQQAAETAIFANLQSTQIAATNIANEEEANQQTQIALARELATNAKDIFSLEIDDQILSGLLAVESMKLYPNIEALRVLQSITLARPISTIKIAHEDDWVTALSFSPDEETKYLAGGTRLGYIHIWETLSGKEIFSATATSEIKKLDFNGQYILAGDYEGNIYVWDVLNRKLNFVIEQEANIVGLQFAQYGNYVVSVENGNNVVEIHIWDVKTGDEISNITYNAALQSFAISSDGKLIALSTYECELYEINSNVCKESDVQLIEIESGREISRLRHVRWVESMAFDSYYNILVTGSSDSINGFISFWSEPWAEPSQIFLPNVSSPVNVAISPNGFRVAISDSEDHTTSIFASREEISKSLVNGDITFSGDSQYLIINGFNNFVVLESGTGEEVARINFESGNLPKSIATNLGNFYRQKNLIATSDCDDNEVCYIHLWDFDNENEVSRSVNLYEINSMDITSDGKIAVTGGYYYGTKVWDVFTGKRIASTSEQDGVTSVSFNPDGKYFVAGGDDGTARIWETQTENEIIRVFHTDRVTSVAFSPDGQYVISGSDDRTIKVWDFTTGNVIVEKNDYYGGDTPIVISSDGKYIASINKDNVVTVWELLTGENITSIPLTNVLSMTFSMNSKYIVLSNSESKIQIWDISRGELFSELTCDCGAISSVDISPNDIFVVSGSDDGTVRVWDILARNELSRMYHDDRATITSFSLDGNYVLSGSDDYTVRVWEIFSGDEVARMTHTAPITVATFSPDGKYVLSAGVAAATGTTDGVRVWFWSPIDIANDVCLRLSRSLNQDEWDKYIGSTLPYSETSCSGK